MSQSEISPTTSPAAGPPWWALPGADPERPLTPEEAAEWLRFRDLGYKDPVATIVRMAARGRIGFINVARKKMFLREHLVEYTRRQVDSGARGRRR